MNLGICSKGELAVPCVRKLSPHDDVMGAVGFGDGIFSRESVNPHDGKRDNFYDHASGEDTEW